MNTVVSDQKVQKQLMLIGGEWVPAQSGETIAVENPGRPNHRDRPAREG
jgi:hypothetical protein